jgi:arylsulfatase A-like enzyme
LALSAGCGLAAGWLEVGTRVLCRVIHPTGRMYMMTRHFVWLVPLANLLLFCAVGLLLVLAMKHWPRGGGWLGSRLLCAAAILPALLIAGPRIYAWAWLIVALGIATRLVPRLERSAARLRRWLLWSIPCLSGSVLVVAGLVFGGDWHKQWRESHRPLPSADSPNVLLIVLDTVRADHLNLYGYPRATSRALERLAERGIRFDEARATAPWTLPSHASMFSGRWPHELGVNWQTPLGGNYPMLAEYLGSRGYATAGFVANTEYCSYDTGLGRGFTHYEDFELDLPHLRPLRLATLAHWAWEGVSSLGMFLSQSFPAGRFLPGLKWLVATGRKDAGLINREFLDWLTDRPEPGRPFFAFLNYFDAHSPYLPPEGARFRFGMRPRTLADFLLLDELFKPIDKARLKPSYRELVGASYDNCLAYLDDRLGELFETLHRRGVLDRTLVIVTADHGEELGGHGLYEHGESLYRPEIRVPLLVVLPSGHRSPVVVPETVSLRDLPATVVDLVGLAAGSPFPGRSLARFWRDSAVAAAPGARDDGGAISELTAPNPSNPSHDRSPAKRGPLVSLAEGDYVYIRNERDRSEELFHEREDPAEFHNRAGDEALRPILERMRRRLDQMTACPPRATR